MKIKPLGFPWDTQDPFLFCAHHRDEYPKGNEKLGPIGSLAGRDIGQDFTVKDGWRMYHGQNVPGFPYHPHRGFETVSIVKEGWVDHSDSLGGAGRFGKDDVQWMTAGKGVQHSEMFPLINEDQNNPLELFQVWLNLPKASKFVEPHYKMLWGDSIPLVVEKDENGRSVEVNIIAGNINGIQAPDPTPDSWAANPDNHVLILTIKLDAGARWKLPKAVAGVNRNLYFYRGKEMFIQGNEIPEYHYINVNSEETLTLEAGDDDCFLLLLQGKPLNESVVQYGPFVMNTDEEIQDAYRDFRQTQFGGWPWPDHEPTHARERGRFAKHADGSEDNVGI